MLRPARDRIGPLVLVVIAVAAVGTSIGDECKAASERKLTDYDRAGPYVLSEAERITEDAALIEASIRDFLWRHWTQHRLGFMIVVRSGTEGLPSRETYFVEPDERGKWRIVSETKTTLLGTKPGSTEHFEDFRSSAAYLVERVEARPDRMASDRIIPSNGARDAISYRLILKDRAAKVIEQL